MRQPSVLRQRRLPTRRIATPLRIDSRRLTSGMNIVSVIEIDEIDLFPKHIFHQWVESNVVVLISDSPGGAV